MKRFFEFLIDLIRELAQAFGLAPEDRQEATTIVKEVSQELERFRPEAITAQRILWAVAQVVDPKRVGSALWVNVFKGTPDVGLSIEVFGMKKFSGNVLLGHHELGAALGYDVASRGRLTVSVIGGAAHPYDGALTKGWAPIAGVRVKF